jgi:hypothetical protein
VVCEVLYEECLSTAGSTLNEVEARADVVNTIKDVLLFIVEVSIFYFKEKVVFKAADVEGLCIFCHWDVCPHLISPM